MGNKLWTCASDGKEKIIGELIREKNLPRAIAMYLASRGIDSKHAESYFNASFSDLSDPFRFPGMEIAVKRLWKAIVDREHILIHGDYDTDGITATALLSWILESNGAIVTNFLPHRFDDGYGFTPESLIKALEASGGSCGVLVTVDCGINSCEAVKYAAERGIDVIITDHHEPGDTLPDSLANINPKIHEELSDLHNLSGVGVAFKLGHAFLEYGKKNNLGGYMTEIREILDFVALGTVADIVPLLGENRILVKHGMEMLRRQLRPGVRALIEVSRINRSSALIKPSDITFKMAPRINAAGRLGNAITALQLMTSRQIVDAYRYADMLEQFNQKRQTKEQEIFSEAKHYVENAPDFSKRYSILAAGEDWHQGVIGIVASRFARDYNRPAIVLTIQNDEAHGSGRSIGGLNLIKVLGKCSHLLTRYGGHPMAVGLGMKKENIPAFRELFEATVREEIREEDLIDRVTYDGSVVLGDLGDAFFGKYDQLGPFGHGNPQPCYRLDNVEIVKTFPIKVGHTKGVLRDSAGDECDFIAFNMVLDMHTKWDIVAIPQINEYYGERRRQIQIADAKPADASRQIF